MATQYHCPNCGAALQALRRSQDFFCRDCFTSLVVIDERWVQMMRAHDKLAQNIPFTALIRSATPEPSKRPEGRSLTGTLSRS